MYTKKVVITGMSVCAPNGIGVQSFEENTLKGLSGCRTVGAFEVPNGFSSTAGIIDDFHKETFFSIERANHWSNSNYKDRLQLLAEFCIDEAINRANLKNISQLTSKKIDLILATAIGSMISMEYAFLSKNIYKKSLDSIIFSSFSFREQTKNLLKAFNLSGSDVVIPTGCVGGCDAIAYATNAIRLGKTDCAIVGAVEAPITPLVITAFGQIKATSTRSCKPIEASKPFDVERDGFVLGEGAGIFILESENHALERGAEILAEIKGYGSVNNCYHMTDITADGQYIKKSCELALEDANMEYNQIDYINAHGSSTKQNDIAESNAFNKIFGDKINNVPVTSLKSQNGHALSAASAIEMVSVVQTIKNQKIPPTINLKRQDPECVLNVIKDTYVNHAVKNVLKTSSGFSGIHTAVIIGKYEE